MDVLAVFKEGKRWPTPLRFKITENGEEKTVEVSRVLNEENLGAGGMARVEYTCESAGARGTIRYALSYYYTTGRWELKRSDIQG